MRLAEHGIAGFVFATEVGWDYGVIGLAEIEERWAVLDWLKDSEAPDPRGADSRRDAGEGSREVPLDAPESASPQDDAEEVEALQTDGQKAELPPLTFIPRGLSRRWVFTKGDPDPYPSVPHGHLEDKNRAWPKLNPYSGRGFSAMHTEAVAFRLSRDEMIILWNDPEFRGFCLEHLAWFVFQRPDWRFRVPNPRRLPRWPRR